MKTFAPVVAITAVLFAGNAVADLCAMGPKQELDGNWFCQPVKAIQYSNVGSSGSYRQITDMNSQTGSCQHQMKAFSGPLAPLNEEVSLHFRGPIHIKQIAAYTPARAKSTKKVRDTNVHQRAHQHVHNRLHAEKNIHGKHKRQDEVTATIDGKIVHWVNNYFGPSPSSCIPPAMVTATIDGQVQTWVNNWFGGGPAPTCTPSEAPAPATAPLAATHSASQTAAQPQAPAPASPNEIPLPTTALMSASAGFGNQGKVDPLSPPPTGPGIAQGQKYERIAYYDSASQTVENLVFLGNHGGQGSGVFSYAFGASLAYVNSAGTAGASSPQNLADTVIPSGSEITVMLGEACGANDCGYVQPGSVAYHGFDGADKVFLIEYMMPMDPGTHGNFGSDMPAIWMLNAQIPRTTQYGPPDCNCWTSGCGEFDIAESLLQGSKYLKSTLHTNKPGGDSDYIERPTSGTMKLAVVFSSSSSTIHIQVLPDDNDFPTALAAGDINKMCQATPDNHVSHFSVA